MVLAAGRGRRLGALTRHTPKPLLKVRGRPLIEHHLHALAAGGITEVVINLSWKGERIRAALGDGARFGLAIRYSEEGEVPLETAGGVVQALPLLGEQPFLLINADNVTDHPRVLPPLVPGDLGRLVLVPNPAHNPRGDFALEGDRVVGGPGPRYTYAGIALLDPLLFAGLTPGVRPLAPLLHSAAGDGRLQGELYDGYWSDAGTVARLLAANRR